MNAWGAIPPGVSAQAIAKGYRLAFGRDHMPAYDAERPLVRAYSRRELIESLRALGLEVGE